MFVWLTLVWLGLVEVLFGMIESVFFWFGQGLYFNLIQHVSLYLACTNRQTHKQIAQLKIIRRKC